MTIKTQFIKYIKNQEQAECDSDGQAKNVEKAVSPVFFKITKCYDDQIFKHVSGIEMKDFSSSDIDRKLFIQFRVFAGDMCYRSYIIGKAAGSGQQV